MPRRLDMAVRPRIRRLFGNFGLKVLALLLAAVFWFFITGGRVVYRDMEVPLELTTVPEGCVVNGQVPAKISIRVQGKGYSVLRARPSEFKVAVNLAGREPGVHRFDLSPADVIYSGKNGIKVERILSERIIMVELERRETRSVPIRVDFGGKPRSGFYLGMPQIDPPRATLYGSAAIIGKLSALVVGVDVEGRDAAFSVQAPIRAPAGITLVGADEARVTVPVGPASRRTFADVIVSVPGGPGSYQVTPARVAVTLEGEAGRLSSIKSLSAAVSPAGSGRYQVRVDVPEFTTLIAVAPFEVDVRAAAPKAPK